MRTAWSVNPGRNNNNNNNNNNKVRNWREKCKDGRLWNKIVK